MKHDEWFAKQLNLHMISTPCVRTIGIDGLMTLSHCAMQATAIKGEFVEMGSWKGFTAAFLSLITDRTFHVYDSFEGLPQLTEKDAGSVGFEQGRFAINIEELKHHFSIVGSKSPIITKAWFNELSPEQLPEHIAFAHIDGDLYESVRDSLHLVYPKLSVGAYCFIHDYNSTQLTGAKRATDEFFAPRSIKTFIGVDGKPACHAYYIHS
jgi:O-methyltransferase